MAATKTGASWEDVWKKVSEVQPGGEQGEDRAESEEAEEVR